MHNPRVLDKLWLFPTPTPTFVSTPDPAPSLSALPSGSEDGQEGCRWGERSHSGSPESPQTDVSSPPHQGTLPVVCRHGYGYGIREHENKWGARVWLITEQCEGRLLLLASKEHSTALSLLHSPKPAHLSSTTQAPYAVLLLCGPLTCSFQSPPQ